LRNVGTVGVRDVYIDIRIRPDNTDITLRDPAKMRAKPQPEHPEFTFGDFTVAGQRSEPQQSGNEWMTSLELNALQPQRVICPPVQWLIGAPQSGTIVVQVRIYGDTLAEPLLQTLTIDMKVKRVVVNAEELLRKPAEGLGQEE
jgi:hypothetical protein